jgi:alanyl-tRNA synthetase
LHELETFCQRAIDEAHPVITKEMGKNEALSMGAMAFFEDKYGDVVRVVHIGEALSMELCGGTHVTNLSEIKAFVLLYDEALSAGVRRLHAICGTPALEYLKNQRTVLTQVEKQLRVSSADIIETLKAQQDQMLGLQKALKQQYQLWVQHQAMQAMPQQAVGPVLSLLLDEKYFNEAVVAADIWKQELPPHVLGLIMQQSAGEQKRFIIVASQKSSWQLNEFLKEAQTVWPQLKGGGRAHMVQAGGTGFEQKQIESTLAQWVESCLSR